MPPQERTLTPREGPKRGFGQARQGRWSDKAARRAACPPEAFLRPLERKKDTGHE